MATEVRMPKWGLTMKEGKLSRWFKSEGEPVRKGDPLFEVETSKITNTVETPADGILFQIVIPAGETVPVQTVLALIAAPGEMPERIAAGVRPSGSGTAVPAAAPEAAGKKEFVSATPVARRLAKEWGLPLERIPGTGPEGRVTENDVKKYKEDAASRQLPEIAADPKVIKLAREMGVDLSQVTGSGAGGKITKADVLRAMGPAAQKSRSVGAPVPPPPVAAGSVIPMDGMRKIIAYNMMASLHNSAQLSVFVEADVTPLVDFHAKIRKKAAPDDPVRIGINDITAFAVCRALKENPLLNSWLTDEGIVLHSHVNLGMAVALPQGLVVPNVKDAHVKTLNELSAAIRGVVELARQGKLTLDEIQGGTFTITNVSRMGIDGFTPILNPPETGILGVGRIVQKPGIDNGQITVRSFMTLSLSFDHRVVDGAPAMRFLRILADYLEDPVMLLA